MGTYFVGTNRTEILDFICKFAREEGLGKVGVREQPDSSIKMRAPESVDLRHPQYTWICKSEGQGSSIELRLRPPILRFLGIHASFVLLAAGVYILGILFIIRGLHAIEHEAFSFGLTLAVMAFFLLWGLRFLHSSRIMLVLERLFSSRLKNCFPSVIQSPKLDIFNLSTKIFLIYFPLTLLIAGLLRATPVAIAIVAPCIASEIMLIIADITVAQSPWAAWRTILLDWIGKWVALCFVIFLVFLMFSCFGTIMLFLSKYEWFELPSAYELLREAFGQHLLYAPRDATSQSILKGNAAIFQEVMAKYGVGKYDPILILEIDLLWRITVCGVIILMMMAAKGFINWIRTWLIIHPTPKPTLSLLPGLRRTSLRRALDRSVTTLILLFAAVGNIFHFLLTVEILSVVFFDRATLSYSVAQALGWLEIDLVAAAGGNVCRHVIGTSLLMILTLPTAITVFAWISYFVGQAVRWFMSIFSAPIDDKYSKMLHKLSSGIGICPPHLYVTKSKESYMVTTIPWLLGKPRISVSSFTLNNLTEPEFKAAISHELSHIKYDATAIRWTRMLSLLSLFSCNAFAILLDMESREIRADNTTIEIVGSNQALARALVKSSLFQVCKSGVRTAGPGFECVKGQTNTLRAMWARVVNCVSLLGLLLNPQAIIGYTHPRIQDRLMLLAKSQEQQLIKNATGHKIKESHP